jgi:hypothetical protein
LHRFEVLILPVWVIFADQVKPIPLELLQYEEGPTNQWFKVFEMYQKLYMHMKNYFVKSLQNVIKMYLLSNIWHKECSEGK